MMASVVLIVWLALLGIGAYMIWGKRMKQLGRVLVLMCIGVLFFFVWVLTALLFLFKDFYLSAFTVLYALIFIAIACALWGVLRKKAVFIPLACAVGLTVLICGIHAWHDKTVESIPTVSENITYINAADPEGAYERVAVLDEAVDLGLKRLPRLDGATALYPVYAAFARAVYPKESIVEGDHYLTCTTTTGAYERIVTGEADIIFAAAPSQQQLEFAREKGVELVLTPIGREAFVFFVNSRNPFEDITVEQIRGIYSGAIKSWAELGVDGLGDIRAFQRDEGSGSQSTLVRLMGDTPLAEPPREDRIDGMGGMITTTADYKNYKNALGFSFRYYSTEMVKNDDIKHLSINGVAPTAENIENRTYPLASEFYAVTRRDADEDTKKLLAWLQGEQAQRLVELSGYTKVK